MNHLLAPHPLPLIYQIKLRRTHSWYDFVSICWNWSVSGRLYPGISVMDQLSSISNTIDRREYLVILHVCQSTIFIYIYIYILINLFYFIYFYFWLCWVFIAAHGLSLVMATGGYSSLQCTDFSLWWLLLLWSTVSRWAGFSSCGTQAQQLWYLGLVALQHGGSSWTRDRTCAPALAGGFLTTVPPGKSQSTIFR